MRKFAIDSGALGMRALVAERKSTAIRLSTATEEARTPFEDVLRLATVLMVVIPITPRTRDLISTPEFALMRPDCVVINVGRGGTVNEEALVTALKERRIFGAATDVFAREPVGSDADSALLGQEARELNLTVTPHLAWCADQTRMNVRKVVREDIEAFVKGADMNVVV